MKERVITFRIPPKLKARLDRVTKRPYRGAAPPTATALIVRGLANLLTNIEHRRRRGKGK
jgi:hypothetical protein